MVRVKLEVMLIERREHLLRGAPGKMKEKSPRRAMMNQGDRAVDSPRKAHPSGS